MNDKQLEILKKDFNFIPTEITLELFKNWKELFLNYNSHTNLMSANDVELLFEKHIYDSLAILKWENFNPNMPQKMLDCGTGGGFPSVILAMCFPNLTVVANDSKIKKINFIIEAKDKLNLKNLKISYSRAEDLEPLECDIVISRAVGKIKDVWRITKKHLVDGGHFVIYKAKTAKDEVEDFINSTKTLREKVSDIAYNLPLKEQYERHLIIIRN